MGWPEAVTFVSIVMAAAIVFGMMFWAEGQSEKKSAIVNIVKKKENKEV